MFRRRWLPVWPLVLMVASSALLIANAGTPQYEPLKWTLGTVSIVVSLVVTSRAAFQRGVPARDRRPWKFLVAYWALALITGVLFMAAFSAGPSKPPNTTFLLPGAITWVLETVPMFLCLVSFAARPMTRPERVRFALDMATVCGGGFIPLWFLVLAPALSSSLGSSQMITITQPVLHLVLIFAVCAMMMRGAATSLRHPLTFVLAGQVAIVAGVIGVGYQLVRVGVAVNVLPLDLIMGNGSNLLLIGAVLQMRGFGRGDVTKAAASGTRRPTVMPYVALGLGYSVLVAAAVRDSAVSWVGLVVGALVMTGAVAGRQVFALRENRNFVVRDALTGLSSRVALYDNLNRAVERSTRTGRPTAVLLIDLNGFKPVNDRLGHAAGDELLVAFGGVLQECVRSGDTAGRLGGDEFAVILPDVTDAAAAQKVAEAVVEACRTPFTAAGEQVVVGASIGVSITEAGEPVSAQELLHRADVAMYKIKQQRGDRHVLLWDLSMDLDSASAGAPVPMPGLNAAELAELDRLRSRVTELERKGGGTLSSVGAGQADTGSAG